LENWLEVILRSIGSFVLLLVMARILGKQTIAQMTYFDFVAGITLGGMAANMTFDIRLPAWDNVLAIIIFSASALLASNIAVKSRKLRAVIAGQPTILIENGKILEKNMKKLRYTLDNLNHQLRQNGIFNPADVEFAILETNGELSIKRKPYNKRRIEQQIDLEHVMTNNNIPIELIMDGKIIKSNLRQNKISEDWVIEELQSRGLRLSDTNYMVIGSDKRLYIDTYEDHINFPRDIE